MGGAQAGELASRLAAAAIEEAGAALGGEEAVVGASSARRTRGSSSARWTIPRSPAWGRPRPSRSSTRQPGRSRSRHVGDSRAYRFRDGTLEQLTTDHSLVAELVRSGRLTEDGGGSPPAPLGDHARARDRGGRRGRHAHASTLAPGDVVLLCSDGLTAMLRDDEIARLLEETDARPARAAEALVRAANRAGGEDNITVVAVRDRRGGARRERPRRRTRRRDGEAGPPSRRRVGLTTDVRAHGAGKGSRWPALAPHPRAARGRRVRVWWSCCGERPQPRALDLCFAGLVASTAFASAWIAGSADDRLRLVPWAGVLAGMFLVAHLVARSTVPDADPTLLPLAALLCAVGLTSIYRLDPEDGRSSSSGSPSGSPSSSLVLLWLRCDYRHARALQVSLRRLGGRAADAPVRARSRGSGSTASGSGSRSGRSSSSRARSRRSSSSSSSPAYLRDKREALARGRLKDLGPLLAIWGAAMLVLVQTSDLGSALLNFGIFLAMLYVATGRALVRRRAGWCCSPAAPAAPLQLARSRPAARHGVARAVDRREGLLLDQRPARVPPELRLVPARQEPLLDRERRLRRHRASGKGRSRRSTARR